MAAPMTAARGPVMAILNRPDGTAGWLPDEDVLALLGYLESVEKPADSQ